MGQSLLLLRGAPGSQSSTELPLLSSAAPLPTLHVNGRWRTESSSPLLEPLPAPPPCFPPCPCSEEKPHFPRFPYRRGAQGVGFPAKLPSGRPRGTSGGGGPCLVVPDHRALQSDGKESHSYGKLFLQEARWIVLRDQAWRELPPGYRSHPVSCCQGLALLVQPETERQQGCPGAQGCPRHLRWEEGEQHGCCVLSPEPWLQVHGRWLLEDLVLLFLLLFLLPTWPQQTSRTAGPWKSVNVNSLHSLVLLVD